MAKKPIRRAQGKKPAPKKSQKKTMKKAPVAKKTAPTSSFKIQPLADRVVVRPMKDEEAGTQRPSGIFIPETVDKERPHEGMVVAVGPGGYQDGDLIPMNVKVGDRVMFSKYGYEEVKIDGQEYFLIKESDILAIIS